MKVAMLAPVAWRTPPRHYGPWETVVSLLTEGLVQRGIDVTLFATADSQTIGKLRAIIPRGYEEDESLNPKVCECLHIAHLFEQAQEFDLIHNHFDFLPLTYSQLVATPVLTTIHGFSSPSILPIYKRYNTKTFYVSISNADRSPELTYCATIYHGIDLNLFDFNDTPDDYLLFFGRFHHDKGAKEAIEVARAAGRTLVMAGIIQDKDYFNNYVAPFIDNKTVVYVGSVGPTERNKLLRNAYALLHLINFNEPFGLSVIESMACGTPVIAVNRGSMPEIITDGKDGILVPDATAALSAIDRISNIDRRECRRTVEQRFTADRMVEQYIDVYQMIVASVAREDHRPWGYYEILAEKKDFKSKRIIVYPGKRLSLQRHAMRDEHWYIQKGRAIVTLDEERFELTPGESVNIPRMVRHRIENIGTDELVFIEIQTGDYFGEDDIERFEDDFGRV
ncbi:MAG: glycosyltransferase [Desulfobacterota bacterium]|nr:glycosyltransferase [Thermodesulfobacteriota bacterium]